MFTAESKAREAITLRAAMQKEILLKEKSKKEVELRELAMKARMEKAGPGGGLAARLDAGGVFTSVDFAPSPLLVVLPQALHQVFILALTQNHASPSLS